MPARTDPPREPWDPARLPFLLECFVRVWAPYRGSEMSGAQEFLRSLLDIYDVNSPPGTLFEQHTVRVPARGPGASQPSLFPGEQSPTRYTAERMDMYLPKVCVWEMKAPTETDLQKHHPQLLRYWSHTRTRYLVLCNFQEFWIYDTNAEDGQLKPLVTFPLAQLPAHGDALLFLRGDTPDLDARPERVTSQVAEHLGGLWRSLVGASDNHARDRQRAAMLILECVFAMFAEDSELIPPLQFTTAMAHADRTGRMDAVWSLFDDFSRPDARDKGNALAPFVNGNLFDGRHPKLQLTAEQIHELYTAAKNYDWLDVRPEIFGSIFEKAYAADERHERGAYFTHEEDILKVVGPTVVEPWRARLKSLRTVKDVQAAVDAMRAFHILDPACGCGNFLYVAYREMKRLEAALAGRWTDIHRHLAKRARDIRPPPPRPYFTILQIHGIEKDDFAVSLARVVLWIGEHLANRELGLAEEVLPLKNLDANVVHGDALTADWPRPDGELAIVGNPPYLGVRKMRRELGDPYVDQLARLYPANRAADLVTHWFTRALTVLRPGERAGYVCTNSIAQNESREASIDPVLAQGGTLTDVWRSYVWPGDAAVHVTVVNWVLAPYEGVLHLDGAEVDSISPGLTAGADATAAETLAANKGLCFMGVTPGNKGFVLSAEERDAIVTADPGSDAVIKPYLVGRDVNREVDQRPTRWIIDFDVMEKDEAETYKGAMRHVRREVYPERKDNRREAYAASWWRFVEARRGMRSALKGLNHVLVIPSVSPHLIVCRQRTGICFDHQLMVVALQGYYHLGVLQSAVHEVWARARCSTLKGDLRYTNTTCFETFPFPVHARGKYAPGEVPTTTAAVALESAARAFVTERARVCTEKKLGLTKVHNLLAAGTLPALTQAYEAMNDAVTDCYGWPRGTWRDRDDTLTRLIARNRELAGGL